MAPPSQLSIATSSVQRLVKEEASYYKELQQQEARLKKTQASTEGDENQEYQLKQERAAIEETKAVVPPLRQRIVDALQKLESQVESAQQDEASEEEISKAKEAIAQAKLASKSET